MQVGLQQLRLAEHHMLLLLQLAQPRLLVLLDALQLAQRRRLTRLVVARQLLLLDAREVLVHRIRKGGELEHHERRRGRVWLWQRRSARRTVSASEAVLLQQRRCEVVVHDWIGQQLAGQAWWRRLAGTAFSLALFDAFLGPGPTRASGSGASLSAGLSLSGGPTPRTGRIPGAGISLRAGIRGHLRQCISDGNGEWTRTIQLQQTRAWHERSQIRCG
mmetsp:Transcript_12195/g.38993  ORF Transcript_12195/g.38993 Transcript_12195/m.38993 type:complete len:218 (-) Transcript_12195:970-1623(-)